MSTLSLLGKKRRSNLVLTLVKKDETKHIEENKTETKEVTTLNDLVAEKEENEKRGQRKTTNNKEKISKADSLKEKLSRSIRSVYTSLVKHLHPDKEMDEEKKLHKTEAIKEERSQRITEALQATTFVSWDSWNRSWVERE